MENFWNKKFQSNEYIYGEEPNPLFKNFIDNNSPGKILLPGEGEGRNAVYAAKKGWTVQAIDLSEIGREKALLLAQKMKVTINYDLGNLLQENYRKDSFDAIALVFFHLNTDLRIKIHKHLISLLKPKGELFIIGFSTNQLNYSSGGPKNENMLYTQDLLTKDFSNLNILKNHCFTKQLNEGTGHKGEASLIIFKAIKPTQSNHPQQEKKTF